MERTMLDRIKHISEFKYLAYGKETDMLEYDDSIIEANLRVLNNQCKLKAFKKALTDMYYQQTMNEIRNGKLDIKEVKEVYENLKKEDDKRLGNVIFITVNPRPDVSMVESKKVVEKIVKKKWVVDYMYVVEQRGIVESEMGKGHHYHLLIWREDGKKPSEIVREIRNTCKTICSVDNPSILNIKNCKDEDIPKRVGYMIGDKSVRDDPTKADKQSIDVVWREKNNLEKYYSHNDKESYLRYIKPTCPA